MSKFPNPFDPGLSQAARRARKGAKLPDELSPKPPTPREKDTDLGLEPISREKRKRKATDERGPNG